MESPLVAAQGLTMGREHHPPLDVVEVREALSMRLAPAAHVAFQAVSEVREVDEDAREMPGVVCVVGGTGSL